MAVIDRIIHDISLNEGVKAQLSDGGIVTITGEKGAISRKFVHSKVIISSDSDSLTVSCDLPRKKDKAICGTWAAHLRNMNKGVSEGFTYKMKAVYSHFPMTMKVDHGNGKFIVNNYFGEKVPREANLPWPENEVKVEVKNKTEVIIAGIDKEKVGQTTANIERCCTVKKRDRRVFQDGIYLVEKN
ncbi:MAG: 50S ribosomal protein L6 [Methanobacteriota archaeon]|nr:MAG: 50S ribosomal protein L6 [Euryarchaeota archaeon]